MLQALLQACFLDADRKIHDWPNHNGYHASHREKARKAAIARWEKERTKEKSEETLEEKRGEESARARRSAPSIATSIAQADGEIGKEILSIDQVKSAVMTIGIPDGFVKWVYEDWESRQGKDGANVPVSIVDYVRKRWSREQTEWRAGNHKGNSKNGLNSKSGQKSGNANIGTLNQGACSGYAEAAKRKLAERDREIQNVSGLEPAANGV